MKSQTGGSCLQRDLIRNSIKYKLNYKLIKYIYMINMIVQLKNSLK